MVHTQKYVNMMEEVGFSKEQAEVSVTILVDSMESRYVTKEDFRRIENRIDRLEQRMDYRFELLESKMTIRLGLMMAASIAVVSTLQQIL